MKARILDSSDVPVIVDILREQEYEVIAPFRGCGRDTYFDAVTDDNRSEIGLHLPNPYYPPKRFVFPHIERLMRIHRLDGGTRIEPTYEAPKRALFGIRSCDVAGILHLDRFYLGGAYRDTYYERRRKNLFIVNLVCSDPVSDIGDECFCVCADTGPAAREGFDLQLMDLGDEYMAVAGTPRGEALFSRSLFRRGTEAHVARRRQILTEARKQFKSNTSWFSAAVRLISSGEVPERVWEEIGNRCLECGGCSYVCPTCSCFTVSDRPAGPDEIERVRIWDTCSLSGFTRMAGGHNPRKAVHDRRNRRFFHKLAHYFIERELTISCVGCGRCAAVCHGEVGMPTVVETIRRRVAELADAASVDSVLPAGQDPPAAAGARRGPQQ